MQLINKLLIKDPNERPSVKEILNNDFVRAKAQMLKIPMPKKIITSPGKETDSEENMSNLLSQTKLVFHRANTVKLPQMQPSTSTRKKIKYMQMQQALKHTQVISSANKLDEQYISNRKKTEKLTSTGGKREKNVNVKVNIPALAMNIAPPTRSLNNTP